MRTCWSCLAAIVLTGVVAAGAIGADATVTCKDGTTSAAGRGACSHHGGVAKGTTAEPSRESTAKPSASGDGQVVCKDGSTARAGRGACSHHGGVAKGEAAPSTSPRASQPKRSSEPTAGATSRSAERTRDAGEHPASNDPTGAIARCKDGSYSHAKQHSGACSHHGGVAQFLDGQ